MHPAPHQATRARWSDRSRGPAPLATWGAVGAHRTEGRWKDTSRRACRQRSAVGSIWNLRSSGCGGLRARPIAIRIAPAAFAIGQVRDGADHVCGFEAAHSAGVAEPS